MKYKWIELPEGYLDISKVIYFDTINKERYIDIRACTGMHRSARNDPLCDHLTIKRYYRDHIYEDLDTRVAHDDAELAALNDLDQMVKEISSGDSIDGIFYQYQFGSYDLTEPEKV